MDRITRKDLKTDKFAVEVEHSVEYVAAHKKQVTLYTAIAVVVALIVGGGLYYRNHQHEQRQQVLGQAIDIMQAMIVPQGGAAGLSFPTEAARQAAAEKAFKEIYDKYPGSDEATAAATYLGAIEVDMNKLSEAEKYFQTAANSSNKNYASVAKLALGELYMGGGRQAEGEKLLRSLIDNPTVFVSKEQATIVLAEALIKSKPAEARKLLDPLKTERAAVSQVAVTLLGQLPPQ